ncbi:YqzL family protein [Paenibacillus koleovorans]|nr:YqzL family protein [Paenibacillus koleovorans]
MRDFSWKYFTLTGDVESYLLYKEWNRNGGESEQEEAEPLPDELDG